MKNLINVVMVVFLVVVGCKDNNSKSKATAQNTPPIVTITTPSGRQSGDITISYTIKDAEGDICGLGAAYSDDNSVTYNRINTIKSTSSGVISRTDILNIPATPQGITHTFVWDSVADGVATNGSQNIRVGIRAIDSKGNSGNFAETVNFSVINNNPPHSTIANISTQQRGDLTVSYELQDVENDLCDIFIEYSVDGGFTFSNPTIKNPDVGSLAGNTINGVTSSSSGMNHNFIWDSVADGVAMSTIEDKVTIRITPSDNQVGSSTQSNIFNVNNLWIDMDHGINIGGVRDIWGTSNNNIFAVANTGVINHNSTILHYDGVAWSVSYSTSSGTLDTLHGTSVANVFVGGQNGMILHYDGVSWSLMVTPTNQTITGIWSFSNTAFAVCGDGTILRYDGLSWMDMNTGITNIQLNAVWGASNTDVYAVGGDFVGKWNGIVLHYDGTSWTIVNIGATEWFVGVSGFSSNDIFAFGGSGANGNGRIFHYDGTWTVLHHDPIYTFTSLWGVAGNDLYVVGFDSWTSRDVILHYDGASWTSPIPSWTSFGISAIWGSSNNELFVGGGYSKIMRH